MTKLKLIHKFSKCILSAIAAIVAFIVMNISSLAGEMLTFGMQKGLALKNSYSGFRIPFETENAFTSRGVSGFCSGQPGHPALPQQTIRLLLPLDAVLSTVEVDV